MLGTDIAMGEGWLRISSSTYILNLCQRWLPHPIEEYDHVATPYHPKLAEFFEAAFLLRGNTPPELGTRYRSLVGGEIFPLPFTRPDCLYVGGLHARAMDFATEDLFKTALYFLVYLGQTHKQGITYTREGVGASEYVHWSDSDWAVRRSTTGGTGQLALGSLIATSRKQDCITGSSTHAEIVAVSTNSNDVLWTRGYLWEIGYRVVMETPTRLMVDAQNVLTLTHNLISSKLSRHITRRELIVREREVEGHHEVTKCDTSDNLADLLTKALDPIPFDKLRRLVLNILAVGAIYPVPRARRIATKAWRNV